MTSQEVQAAIDKLAKMRDGTILNVAQGHQPSPGYFNALSQDIEALTKLRDRLMGAEASTAGARK